MIFALIVHSFHRFSNEIIGFLMISLICKGFLRACVPSCLRACVRACARACVWACMRACARAGRRACVRSRSRPRASLRACARARTCVHACVRVRARAGRTSEHACTRAHSPTQLAHCRPKLPAAQPGDFTTREAFGECFVAATYMSATTQYAKNALFS